MTIGSGVRQVEAATAIQPGTLMQKVIPPRLVEPYLTGRRAIICGFVYKLADTSFAHPADYYRTLGLAYEGSEYAPDMAEVYVLRWRALGTETYQVPYSPALGGDWALQPPFTGTGYSGGQEFGVAEFYTDSVPVPVGTEMYRVSPGVDEFIARFDGQVWLRPAGGS
jgi:hypothetical protein